MIVSAIALIVIGYAEGSIFLAVIVSSPLCIVGAWLAQKYAGDDIMIGRGGPNDI